MSEKIFDSNGVEIKHGDIVECPGEPEDSGLRYHAAFKCDLNWDLEIRDLGCNNIGMYTLGKGGYFNIGPFWKHLDKLTDDDLFHYWSATREQCEEILEAIQKAWEDGYADN